MMNQQLVDYIKQQLAAGVPGDAVTKALADAGWQQADIDDSMKAAAPAAPSSAMPAGMSPAAGPTTVGPTTIDPVVAMGGMNASDPAAKSAAFAGPSSSLDKKVGSSSDRFFAGSKPASTAAAASYASVDDEDSDHPETKKFVVAMVVMGAVILLLAGSLAFVYFNLNGQLESARNGGSADTGQTTALQGQVSQLNSEKEALESDLAEATEERDILLSEIGFFAAAPAGSAAPAAPVEATVSGTLSGNASTTFVLLTPHNVRITVANSAAAPVAAALTPLADGTTEMELSGTHPPASAALTVTAVNGVTIQ